MTCLVCREIFHTKWKHKNLNPKSGGQLIKPWPHAERRNQRKLAFWRIWETIWTNSLMPLWMSTNLALKRLSKRSVGKHYPSERSWICLPLIFLYMFQMFGMSKSVAQRTSETKEVGSSVPLDTTVVQWLWKVLLLLLLPARLVIVLDCWFMFCTALLFRWYTLVDLQLFLIKCWLPLLYKLCHKFCGFHGFIYNVNIFI